MSTLAMNARIGMEMMTDGDSDACRMRTHWRIVRRAADGFSCCEREGRMKCHLRISRKPYDGGTWCDPNVERDDVE